MAADGLEELAARRRAALAMGGEANVARHRAAGKLTARERIDAFVDADSFEEFGMLRGSAEYRDGELVAFTPKGSVEGMCLVDRRRVVVSAGDFTVRGGSAASARAAFGMEMSAPERALEWRLPYVRLQDAAGGSVRSFEELGRTYVPDGSRSVAAEVALMNVAPIASVVMGSVAGLPAVEACLAHWNVMVKGSSQLFPGGPPVVKAALGQEISKEDLGGYQVHTQLSGTVDNVAESEEDALDQARRFLSYLPSSIDELSPLDDEAPPEGAAADLRGVVPENQRQLYDVRKVLDCTLDDGSFFEIAPNYGRSRITGLGRVAGHPVGVMANDTRFLGGATDAAAGQKVIRLVQLCSVFHLPLVSFADEPGFLVGPASERDGIERAGARLVSAMYESRMPMITFALRRLYGVGGLCHHRPTGMFRRYAWPTARWGSMHIQGGVAAAYRREIESAPDPQAKTKEIERRLELLGSPFRTAESTGQDIIDPAETRAALVSFVLDAQRVLARQVGTVGSLSYRP